MAYSGMPPSSRPRAAPALQIDFDALPLSAALRQALGEQRARELALTGGDDYELCFCVHPDKLPALLAELPPQHWGYQRIGTLRAAPGAVVVRDGTVMEFSHSGYEHFA